MGKRDKEPIRKFSDSLTFCRSNKGVLSEFCFEGGKAYLYRINYRGGISCQKMLTK